MSQQSASKPSVRETRRWSRRAGHGSQPSHHGLLRYDFRTTQTSAAPLPTNYRPSACRGVSFHLHTSLHFATLRFSSVDLSTEQQQHLQHLCIRPPLQQWLRSRRRLSPSATGGGSTASRPRARGRRMASRPSSPCTVSAGEYCFSVTPLDAPSLLAAAPSMPGA